MSISFFLCQEMERDMNIDELITYLLTPVAQVALIIGIAELIKRIGLETRWIPVIDLVLGLVSGVCIYGLAMGYGIVDGIVLGIALGLSACGLFSGIKNVTEKDEIGDDYDE